MSRFVTVAALSIPRIKWDKEAAYRKAEEMIREAAERGAHIICTTECFLDGYVILDEGLTLGRYRTAAEPIPNGEYARRLLNLARELKIYLVAGLAEVIADKIYNSAVLISPAGEVIGKHHKVRSVGSSQAETLNTPGDHFSVFETPLGKVGMMICADRKMLELHRLLALQGTELALIPSAGGFGEVNEMILRMNARENLMFVVHSNVWSCVMIDPRGQVIARSEEIGRVTLQEINLDEVPKGRFDKLRETLFPICRALMEELENSQLGSVDISREPYKSGDKAEKSKITDS